MEKILAAWNLKTIQEALNLHMHLLSQGKSWDDVRIYLKEAVKNREKRIRPALKCPDCGHVVRLYPVNDSPRTQVGGKYRSQTFCPACGHARFYRATVAELIRGKVTTN